MRALRLITDQLKASASPIFGADADHENDPLAGKPVLFLFVAMFALLPVYVFPSGGFNLADVPMLLIMGYILLTHRKSEMLMQSSTLITLSAFLFWAVTVNMINFLISSPLLCVRASLQIFYTTFLFITLTIFFYRTLLDVNAIKYIYLAVLLSAVMPLLMNGMGMSAGFMARQGLSFPNPNQLAYFAQLIFATILVLNYNTGMFYPVLRTHKLIRLSTILVIILAHGYIFLSASRAGLVGIAYLDILAVRKKKKLVLTAFLAFIIIISAMSYLNLDKIEGMKMYKRLKAGAYYSGLYKRTEGRFNFADLSFMFGGGKARRSLGEKKSREFKEVHNTLGDVVYSYGLIGGVLFVLFIYFYFRTCSAVKYNVLILLSFLPMHVTHNMIRFRLMWILYALVYSACLVYLHSSRINIDSRDITPKRNPAIINHNYVASELKKT